MKGIFMEVLKCFGIKMVSFGGNMGACSFLRNQRFLSSEKNHRERLLLAFYAIVVARNKMVINVQFKAVLFFHKHTVILPDKTCVANCIL